jgi:hypothetical protein
MRIAVWDGYAPRFGGIVFSGACSGSGKRQVYVKVFFGAAAGAPAPTRGHSGLPRLVAGLLVI